VGLVTRAEEALREAGLPFDADTALAMDLAGSDE
jgi:hypothetical protein